MRQALLAAEQSDGPAGRSVRLPALMLALIYDRQPGIKGDAELYYRLAQESAASNLRAEHGETALATFRLGEFLHRQGRENEAARFLSEALSFLFDAGKRYAPFDENGLDGLRKSEFEWVLSAAASWLKSLDRNEQAVRVLALTPRLSHFELLSRDVSRTRLWHGPDSVELAASHLAPARHYAAVLGQRDRAEAELHYARAICAAIGGSSSEVLTEIERLLIERLDIVIQTSANRGVSRP